MTKKENNFVGMATHKCPICGTAHQHNTEILIHKRFGDIPKDLPASDWSLCEKDQGLLDDGYVALIGANNPSGNVVKLEEADRTGELVHMKRDAFHQMFNTGIGDLPFVFVEPEVIKMLEGFAPATLDAKE